MKFLRKSPHRKIVTIFILLTLVFLGFVTQVRAAESAAAAVPAAQAQIPAAQAQGEVARRTLYQTVKTLQQGWTTYLDWKDELNVDSFFRNMFAAAWGSIFMNVFHVDYDVLKMCMQPIFDGTDTCGGLQCVQDLLISNGGAAAAAGRSVAVVGSRPSVITLAAYKNDMLANSFFGKTAYAQGIIGEELLRGTVLSFWKVMRNLSYFAFVVILIAVGFMIMFRYKLGPQTSVTLMNALPRVAIALVLVTFSYPIVALLLDLTAAAFAGLTLLLEDLTPDINPWAASFGPAYGSIFAEPEVLYQTLMAAGVCQTVQAGVGLALGGFVGAVLSLFAAVAAIIALFAAVVNFLLRLVKVLLMTALAPIIITWGAVPGSDAIVGWFRGLAANLLSMLGIWLFLLLGVYFYGALPATAAWGLFDANIALGSFLTLIAAPVIATLIFFKSWSIPGTIERALAGKGVPGWYTQGGGKRR